MHRTLIAASLLTAAFAPVAAQAQSYTPKGPIESKYQAQGPWAVSTMVSPGVCDRNFKLCDIWYPTNLGTNPIKGMTSGFKHPVIVWANGTFMAPSNYSHYLQHLASWGFIVIASRETGTGSGGTTIDAANYIIARGNAAGNIFHGKVDAANVGASGHSQGGSTVIRLATDKNVPFKTFVPIHGVASLFGLLCCGLTTGNLGKIPASRSILYIGGTGDSDNATKNQEMYSATASAVNKAVGILNVSKHDDIMGKPACDRDSCAIGVYGYLGYPTAWFMWKLQGATDAPAAFKSVGGEFTQANAGWKVNLSNIP